MNRCIELVKENTRVFTDLYEFRELDKSGLEKLTESVLSTLTESFDSKKVSFPGIEESKGNLEKVKDIDKTLQCIKILNDSYRMRNSVPSPLLVEVTNALSNITKNSNIFTKAFKIRNDHLMTYYNTLVASCIAGVSLVINEDVTYNKTGSVTNMIITPSNITSSYYNLLKGFNESVKNGSFIKESNAYLNKTRESLNESILGVGMVAAAGKALLSMGIAASIIPMIRTSLYIFYYTRMKISDFLEQQASFVEANKAMIEKSSDSTISGREKIIIKQEKAIDRLRRLSDKIKVDYSIASKKAQDVISEENKGMSYGNMKNGMTSNNLDGFELM